MSRYARFQLTFPGVWTSLADGRFRCADGTVGEHHVRDAGEVLVDLENGELHADDLRHQTIFAVFGIDDVSLNLNRREGTAVALTIADAVVRERLQALDFLTGRFQEAPFSDVLIIDRLMPAESLVLLVEILRIIADLNAADDGRTPMQPKGTLEGFTVLRAAALATGETYLIDYTNYRGKRETRHIRVTGFAFGTNVYHLRPGLMIEAHDLQKDVPRTYTGDGIHAIWAF